MLPCLADILHVVLRAAWHYWCRCDSRFVMKESLDLNYDVGDPCLAEKTVLNVAPCVSIPAVVLQREKPPFPSRSYIASTKTKRYLTYEPGGALLEGKHAVEPTTTRIAASRTGVRTGSEHVHPHLPLGDTREF